MFVPVKADFTLPRFPWLTAIVCAVCLGIFSKQVGDWKEFENAVYTFCNADRSHIAEMIFREISDDSPDACIEVMYQIAMSDDSQATIEQMVSEMRPLTSLTFRMFMSRFSPSRCQLLGPS